MLQNDQINQAAAALDAAERSRQQMRPLSLSLQEDGYAMTMDDAYAIQKAWVDQKIERGDRISGYKIGLTSRAMQQAMNIDTPDYGVLMESMAIANGATVDPSHYLDPRIEAEFAFVLRKPLAGTHVSVDQVLDATDYVVPALELISARSTRIDPATGYTRNVFDTIADNAANAGYIPGDQRCSPTDVDLRWSGALLYLDGVIEETGLGAAVMDHPAAGVSWVCRRFAAHGVGLEPGQFILAGSFTRPVPVGPGSEIRADYGPLGVIEVSFQSV